jgi:hypothetical protein
MVIILVFSNNSNQKEQWIQNGGTLIGYQEAIKWLNESKLELNLKQIKQMQKNISFEQVNDYKGFPNYI